MCVHLCVFTPNYVWMSEVAVNWVFLFESTDSLCDITFISFGHTFYEDMLIFIYTHTSFLHSVSQGFFPVCGIKPQRYSGLRLKHVSPWTPAETFEPCSHPGIPTYGIPSSTHLHFQAGETLNYSCLTGHQLLGEPVLHCVPGHPSQWSGLPPVCKGKELQP